MTSARMTSREHPREAEEFLLEEEVRQAERIG
jgi:hypothetical protein